MYKSRKIITWLLVAIGVTAAILFIAASIYINRFKPHMEDLLTSNIGMPTRIDGPISLKVMPGLSFAAHKVKVVNNETYVLRIEKVEISVDYTKIFSKTIHIRELHFKRPQLFIQRELDGSYNFETPMASVNPSGMAQSANHEINLEDLTIKDASILYIDRLYQDTLKAEGIYLESEDIGLTGSLETIEPKKIRFSGKLAIDQFKLNQLMIDSMVFDVRGDGGKLEITEKSKPFLGGTVTGKIMFDFNQHPVSVHNRHRMSGMHLDDFFKSIGSVTYLSGMADYELDMRFSSFGWSGAMSSLEGTFDLQGTNLTVHGIDLHRMINRLTSAQTFNSVDLMAILLAGPYGAVFSKGMDFGQLISGDPADQTPVRQLRSKWKINRGQAATEDVAINTGMYRIAVQGILDLTTDQYQGLEIAILNREGCAAFSQTLEGPFMDPETSGMLNLGLLSGQLDNLPNMLARPSPKGCLPFYKGSVKHP